MQGFLTRDGTSPGGLLELGRAEVRGHGGEVLLVATGLVDELPDVPGLGERWGRDVFHCPYRHGWEVRDQAVGVLGSGPLAVHGALLIGQWTHDVTLFVHTAPAPTPEQREQLAARGVRVVEGEGRRPRRSGDRSGCGGGDGRRGDQRRPRRRGRPGRRRRPRLAGGVGMTGGHAHPDPAPGHGSHDHGPHDHGTSGPPPQDAASWDERYRSVAAVWSGRPNPQLLVEASDLPPGTALDVGCGEGADAIWLAERGWTVTAVDISTLTLDRAAARARLVGDEVARRITWQPADVTGWVPGASSFDLVSAQFMQLPLAERIELHRRLAASVAPGGPLLVVGHHPGDLQTTAPRPQLPELFFTADDVAAVLDPGQWQVVTLEARARPLTDPDGRDIAVLDAVLRAHRLA